VTLHAVPNDPGAALSHDTPAAVNVANAPKFLNALEVADRLRVSRSTVYNLIASGRLTAYRNGGGKVRPRGVRIPESAVEAYLNGSLVTPIATEVA
jgi:excisionase family DNA binding protein